LAKQLTLDLGHRAALGRDDFLVTPSNAAAVALVDQWPKWPGHAAVLAGSGGSGKSHLATVWQNISGAKCVEADALTVEAVPDLLDRGALIVENLPQQNVAERPLFHLLNHAQQNGGYVLITSAGWPIQKVLLPDLQSRLLALPVAHILPPDDELLRGVLVKHFADRQIAVDEALVGYLVTRMPRSLDTARQLVARIDAEALEQGAEVTRGFAAKILAGFENPDLF
jgi:chromosomal replication initiation ATPase DnaA